MSEGQQDRIQIQFEATGPDVERLVVVGGDLEYLQSLPKDRLFTHTEVRLTAGVLRRLLIDGGLKSAQRIVGEHVAKDLMVEATDIDKAVSQWPPEWIRFGFAGGASPSSAQHSGVILGEIPREATSDWLPFQGEKRTVTVENWLRSTSVAIGTNDVGLVKISRQAVVSYIANRKGGIHFDSRRNLNKFKGRRQRREIETFFLDHGLLRVGHLSGPEFEVQSMVQTITEADWAHTFVDIAHSIAPEDFYGDPNELKLWTGLQEEGTGWSTWKFHPSTDQPAAAGSG